MTLIPRVPGHIRGTPHVSADRREDFTRAHAAEESPTGAPPPPLLQTESWLLLSESTTRRRRSRGGRGKSSCATSRSGPRWFLLVRICEWTRAESEQQQLSVCVTGWAWQIHNYFRSGRGGRGRTQRNDAQPPPPLLPPPPPWGTCLPFGFRLLSLLLSCSWKTHTKLG